MNIFNIGGMELLLIITIALIVAGPKRIAIWAYQLGVWASKLQNLWSEFANTLQKEMDEAGFDVQIPRSPPTRDQITRSVQEFGREISKAAEAPIEEVKKEVEGIKTSLEAENSAIRREVNGTNGVQRADMRRRGSATESENTDDNDDVTPGNDESPSEQPDATNIDFGSWGGKQP